MARKTAEENRRHVLAVASRLYYQRGIRAVGMDLVVKESGVGNATVYRQFPTKDALASAYTQDRADAWFARMRQVADQADDPREKLLAIFTAVIEETRQPTFRGCPMLNTHTEFPDPQHPANRVAVTHEQRVRDWMRDLAADARASDPEQLADDLTLVLNGVYVTATVLGPQGPAQRTGELARRLIWTACDESGPA
ncbi:TetR/AcrR family transcriptional regulator [Streptomyces rhizosphaericus]|uniref:TetR family transcriptional regulator n=1 Tax=Streptomyces rhizosphaericus TaxID=114699 RepID=A0A6G4AM48_9ACTN|nr:TetR family transcriptional regulator [Streptomyces rhizosphaericus]NEW74453.1 TetR family transcriptional regulator [Streptomyces rhizosphaericus]